MFGHPKNVFNPRIDLLLHQTVNSLLINSGPLASISNYYPIKLNEIQDS